MGIRNLTNKIFTDTYTANDSAHAKQNAATCRRRLDTAAATRAADSIYNIDKMC